MQAPSPGGRLSVSQSFTYGAQDFVGEGVVVDGAGEGERSDERADSEDGLAPSVVAMAELPSRLPMYRSTRAS